MRIVMMGTGVFSESSFETLLHSNKKVIALFTQPDKQIGDEKASTRQVGKGMKNIAANHNIPVFQPANINLPDGLSSLQNLKPDLLVVAAYGQILSPQVLAIPSLGGINVHASLLPKYRGAAPIQWAISNMEIETGVTIIQMTPSLDAGNILASQSVFISPVETAGELESRLASLGATLALSVINQMEIGPLSGLPQDISLATKAPKLRKEHGNIDWDFSAASIAAHIRAMQPWPTAYSLWKRDGLPPLRMLILKAQPSEDLSTTNLPSGTILEPSKDLAMMQVVAGQNSILNVLEIQPAGKRRMHVAEFFRGKQWLSGDYLSRA